MRCTLVSKSFKNIYAIPLEIMYYFWSFLASLILFIAIQYNEYRKNPVKYNAYTLLNMTTFIIIYLMLTILFYFMLSDTSDGTKLQKGGTNISSTATIDPSILKKIPDSIYTGFRPYDGI